MDPSYYKLVQKPQCFLFLSNAYYVLHYTSTIRIALLACSATLTRYPIITLASLLSLTKIESRLEYYYSVLRLFNLY